MLTASVVICTYTDRRWELFAEAVGSLLRQSRPPHEIILVIDHNDELLARAADRFPQATVVPNAGARGLSGARNSGVRHATGDVVAFLDDDARAAPDWLEQLLAPYADPRVVGAGGLAVPRWQELPPRWLPSEFMWTVGCSYRGLPEEMTAIRNPIGANMSCRRAMFDASGGFMDGIGRIDTIPLGCEETEFFIRLRQRQPGSVVLHVPDAQVHHLVTPDRATWSYFRSRCWSEGLSKALVSSEVGADDALSSERTYATRTLPTGVLRGFRDLARGDISGLARAGAIIAGLAVTTTGYIYGRLRSTTQ